MYWFLYDNDLRHERVKSLNQVSVAPYILVNGLKTGEIVAKFRFEQI